ncbi:hypothetical protein [Limosilactobacillus oris]|uniref:hypothetical protein n=1 Tax=Limosilactobacillus oris TaxID=1632 RepID=UPI0024B3B441|nr:hypothetical protein [Limosilactobacillus oris]WHO85428.1 hypothetical protein QLX69_08740 [Limosilactobacillus oris]
MEEKHEIIAPNFISKPSSMSSPTHASYKHIAAKVELKGIRLTILTTGRDEILALLTGLPLALKTGATISCFSSIKKSSCTESYAFSIGGLVDRA